MESINLISMHDELSYSLSSSTQFSTNQQIIEADNLFFIKLKLLFQNIKTLKKKFSFNNLRLFFGISPDRIIDLTFFRDDSEHRDD